MNSPSAPQSPTTPARKLALAVAALLALVAFIGFILLGNWQLERRLWKLDLMQRVEQRVNATPSAAPAADEWSQISREADEYRRLAVRGQFHPTLNITVVAATELGSGYWVLTPLVTEQGTVMVNRGYIAQGQTVSAPPKGEVTVSGLLRLPEPKGSVLRDNDPAQHRWYSRDIAAMAQTYVLPLAPYFIDADAQQPGSPGGDGPVGGLTVVRFHNSHLVYAITWYTLALMVVGAAVLVWREQRR